mgnify:FL=1
MQGSLIQAVVTSRQRSPFELRVVAFGLHRLLLSTLTTNRGLLLTQVCLFLL